MSNRLDDSVKPGDTLDGKYVVERVLGSGGMGVVVQARHKTLNKRVAIKFMRAEQLQDGESVARFQREANAAASLQSEHTARVQDTGRLADGAPYMVMEFLVGKDLGQLVEDNGALPGPQCVELVLQACEALAEAHARGIVHRDIKPRNLFLTQTVDGRPLLKVLDFGLAKHVDSGNDHALTRTTAVMGSPQYMSPEQMRASRDVDRRTDIWSLGVCLYELLTGTVPFDAPTVPMLCALVLKDAPRAPHEVNPTIPVPLSMAVMRCLEKDPGARYLDVAELADALQPFAGPSALGSAGRVRSVLVTTQPFEMPAHEPTSGVSARSMNNSHALDATLAHSDTKTAASFDSKQAPRASSLRVAAAIGASAASLFVIVVIVVFSTRHRAASGDAIPSAAPPVMVDMPPVVVPEAVSPLAIAPSAPDAGPGQGQGSATVAPIATMVSRPAGASGGPRKPPIALPTPPKPLPIPPAVTQTQPPPPPLPTVAPPIPTKDPGNRF